MQEHSFSFEVDGTPQEVWALVWGRRQRVIEHGDVRIEYLHWGDENGEGRIRHCEFRVPRYLLSRGVGRSWEWLTEVKPYESWRYDAIGKPLWSHATGHTRLEDLGDGRTRIHFRETYEAFNPLLGALLERRVHRFISRDNDRVMKEAINGGLKRLRALRSVER
ncbi:MAG: polyketide cyclase / dehydrase and lipid transport family protein [Thermodesulfobacteriota bacterium]